MGDKTFHGILKNISILYLGEVISQIMTFFLVVYISRALGDEGLGKYSFIFTFSSLFFLFSDLGLQTLVAKDLSKKRSNVKFHLTNTHTLKLALNIASSLICIISIFFSGMGAEIIKLLVLATIAMNFYYSAGIIRAVFQAYQRMEYETIAKFFERLVALAIGVFLLTSGYGIFELAVALVISNVVYYAMIHIYMARKILKPGIDFNVNSWKKSILSAFPYWLTIIFINIYFRIDTVMLGFMRGFAETGWYNAAYKIIDVLTRVPMLFIMAVFPVLARLTFSSRKKAEKVYEKSFYYLLVLGVPIVTGLFILSGKIIDFVYGSGFANSVIAMKVLSFALIFIFVNYHMGYLLNSIDRQKLFTLTTGMTTLFNIVLNLIVIPKYGFVGAAASTVASEVLNFGMLYYFTSKYGFYVSLARVLWKPLVADAVMVLAVLVFYNVNLFALVFIGAASYIASLLIINGVREEEKALMADFARKLGK